MSAQPLFTEKHFEYLMTALREDAASPESKQRATEFLCRVFERVNPKFKRDRFVCGALGRSDRATQD